MHVQAPPRELFLSGGADTAHRLTNKKVLISKRECRSSADNSSSILTFKLLPFKHPLLYMGVTQRSKRVLGVLQHPLGSLMNPSTPGSQGPGRVPFVLQLLPPGPTDQFRFNNVISLRPPYLGGIQEHDKR